MFYSPEKFQFSARNLKPEQNLEFIQTINQCCGLMINLHLNSIKLDRVLLEYYSSDNFDLFSLHNTLQQFKKDLNKQCFPEKDITVIKQEFSQENKNLSFPLDSLEFNEIIQCYNKINNLGKIDYENASISELQNDSVTLCSQLRSEAQSDLGININSYNFIKFLALIRETFRRFFNIYPYSTQILTVLGLVKYYNNNQNKNIQLQGRIAQVQTGEGKSTITTMLAMVIASRGQTVDIITSNSYLAQRDQEKFQDFFQFFGIKTSSLADDNSNPKNFSGQILYGNNTDFQFAVLRDSLNNLRLRRNYYEDDKGGEKRQFNTVIVDEVDNLLIDKSTQSAVLASSSGTSISFLLYYIFSTFSTANSKEKFKIDEEFINQTYLDAKQTFQNTQLSGSSVEIQEQLIRDLINSANIAINVQKQGKDYIIAQRQKFLQGQNEYHDQVVLVDHENTGQLQEGCRWQGYIHQFTEIKHGIQLGPETLTSASLFHPVFFNKYNRIFGLTGTVGTSQQRQQLLQVYSVDTFDVPTYHPPQRITKTPRIFVSEQQQFDAIMADIIEMKKARRPVLILCQKINDTTQIKSFLNINNIECQLLNAQQAEQEEFLVSRAGYPGMVTVATNAAGRGTDMSISKDVQIAGGLHLIFTFYPKNLRVQQQGFGRAGRQGNQGSCVILMTKFDEEIGSMVYNSQEEAFNNLLIKRENTAMGESLQRILFSFKEKLKDEFQSQFFALLENWYEEVTDGFLWDLQNGKNQIMLKFQDSSLLQFNFSQLQSQRDQITRDIIYKWAQFYNDLKEVNEREKMNQKFNQYLSYEIKFLNDPQNSFLESLSKKEENIQG